MKILISIWHATPRTMFLMGLFIAIFAYSASIRVVSDVQIQKASLELDYEPDTLIEWTVYTDSIAQEILAQVKEENWYRQYDSLGVFSLEDEVRYCVWNKKTGAVDLSQCWSTHEQFQYTQKLKKLERVEQLEFIPVRSTENLAKQMAYVEKWHETAMKEQVLFGIPASISLAQGILESGSGTSSLARNHNNHFGIKYRGMIPEWAEESTRHWDPIERSNHTYRSYSGAWWSWRDHSKFLKYTGRYRRLFKLDPTDYRGWAKGLKRAGYATDKDYAEKLINLIETLHLHQYDLMVQELQ